jgi:hypothetical protein
MNAYSMSAADAIAAVLDKASRWGENTEEGFSTRVTEETTDEQCAEIAEASEVELEEVVEVRDLWRAAATLQAIADQQGCEHFDPAVKDGKLTSLIDVVVFG